MKLFDSLKEKFAGWSVWVLVRKLAGRYIPISAAAFVGFIVKWAPEGASDSDQTKAAVTTVLWILLEAMRNFGVYAISKKQVIRD